jgi:hypothetical protein
MPKAAKRKLVYQETYVKGKLASMNDLKRIIGWVKDGKIKVYVTRATVYNDQTESVEVKFDEIPQ